MSKKTIETENKPFAVLVTDETHRDRAEDVARRLGVPCFREEPDADYVLLKYEKEGVCLSDGELSVTGDFEKLTPRLKKENLASEMVVRAVKIKDLDRPVEVIDATAGMGEDSFLLAGAGCHVRLIEHDPIVFELLDSAIARAKENPGLCEIACRMTPIFGDSVELLPKLDKPDVVLLDPMFPERQKSGLVKKKFQLIHKLEKPCDTEKELMASAISSSPMKIVVKRPQKGEPLAGVKPSYTLPGKAIRYDVIVPPKK